VVLQQRAASRNGGVVAQTQRFHGITVGLLGPGLDDALRIIGVPAERVVGGWMRDLVNGSHMGLPDVT
jgi:hypothetical protein